MNNLYVIVMAGGRGTRFWPRSRRSMPKQCLSLDGGRTLIQRTLDRIRPLAPAARVLVITAADMAPAIAEQLPELPPENLLVEPEGRNTAPCVGWGVVEVRRRAGPDAVIAVLPADHLIKDEEALRSDLTAAASAAVASCPFASAAKSAAVASSWGFSASGAAATAKAAPNAVASAQTRSRQMAPRRVPSE